MYSASSPPRSRRRCRISASGPAFVGPGNLVPGLPLSPQTPEDRLRVQKALELNTVDDWLNEHGFNTPEIRDPAGQKAVLDGRDTTVEQVADRALAALGPAAFLRRQEILAHVRQKYVAARGGPATQAIFGYTLVPRGLQTVVPTPDPLNPLHTQHQFSFTITRQRHANDFPGEERSLQGSVTFDDTGSIVNVQAGGQEAVVAPLLRGWIQVSGFVQAMASANWSQSASGRAIISPGLQAAVGGQVLVTPNFRGGPFAFLNGHVQIDAEVMGAVQATTT